MNFLATALCALVSLSATSALAHARVSPAEVINFTTVRAAITIPHGCDGAPTTEVIVSIPEGFVSAAPMAKPGWTIETKEAQYKATYQTHSGDVSSGTVEIHWSGGSVPEGQFDDFVFEGQMQAFNDQSLFVFPTTQFCGTDKSVVWNEEPSVGVDPHSLKHPAPIMSVSNEASPQNHADHLGMDMGAPSAIVGGLEISEAFVRATLPNAPVGGGYLTILNRSNEPDRLLSASSPDAGSVELHSMRMEGDVMKMELLKDGIEIPAGPGAVVTLSPDGTHLMFKDMRLPFIEGEAVIVNLIFEKAGAVSLTLPVAGAAADAPVDHTNMPGM